MRQKNHDGEGKLLSSHSISRMSFGLFVAAVVLVVPLMVLVYLYLTELNREIKLLDRQVSSVRVMQQFVALQINLIDEYYGRFYPSNQALEQFSREDSPVDTSRSRAEPIALLATQLQALEQELEIYFDGEFRTWPIIKNQLVAIWDDEIWSSNFGKLFLINHPGREFVNDLFAASNLDLSSSAQIRAAAHLLYVDVGQAKVALFTITERLALLIFSPPKSTLDDEIKLLDGELDRIYGTELDERTMHALEGSELLSGAEIAREMKFEDMVRMSKRLLEKKRRLLFIGALEGEVEDMGLAVEVETLRGMTWDKFNGHNRIQIQLARFLEYELVSERDALASWRVFMLIAVLSLAVFGVLLGTYIISHIRMAQTQLGRQNMSLEATVKSRTAEIVSAKNEAEQLNKILGKQTQISNELARKAEMASSAKSLFLAAMSHEIRTPLNAVLGGATILGKTELNARQKNILNLITQSGKTLLALINEILDFSKIEADQLHLESIPFDLEATIIDIVSMFSLKAKEKSIYLRLFIDSRLEGKWVGDPLRIKQIVINLLSNAMKFTHIGGVSVRAYLNEKREVVIGVHDSGIGIQSDQLKFLFEAFVQSDSSTTRKYGGTGLGLSISKRLAVLHEGDISVESTLGRGSNFLLSLPLQRSGESIVIDSLKGVEVCLLSNTPELERQLRQWFGQLQVFEDINQLTYHLDALDAKRETNLVIVAESASLIHHHDQWIEEVTHRDAKRLEFPWVLLTSQDAIDCENSQQISEELRTLGANVQLPLFSSGLLIRQAIKRAISNPKNTHENWVANNEVEESRQYRGRVLLVEDVYFNRVIATELLESFGLVVESAENGLQAVDFMERVYNLSDKNPLPLKLILMDLHMPEMNGLDATRRIREMETNMRLSATPIVAMTADVLVDTRGDIVDAGMNGYLPKPFEESDLHNILTTYYGLYSGADDKYSSKAPEAEASTSNGSTYTERTVTVVALETTDMRVFDDQALSLRLRGRADRMAELTESFLSSLPLAVQDIQALINDQNFKELIFAAHTLKGSAGNLGAVQLQHASARMEQLAKALHAQFDEAAFITLQTVAAALDNMVDELANEIKTALSHI